MKRIIVICFAFFMSYQAYATDLYVEKDKLGNVIAAFSMHKEIIDKKLALSKLSDSVPLTSFELLNNYYFWGYKNNAEQALLLYAKTDNSWQRLKDKLSKGKSPFKNFSKLTGVHVKEKLLWGDYQLFKLTWDVQGKSYNWTDTIYCNNRHCSYSDILLRFLPLENMISAVLAKSIDNLTVNKKGLKSFDVFPKGATKNPMTFHYNFKQNNVQIWPLGLKKNELNSVKTYLSNLHVTDFSDPAQHKETTTKLVAKYWQDTTLDMFLQNYTYQDNTIKIQGYSLAAYNKKLLSFETVTQIGSILSNDGQFVLCKGKNLSGVSELFFVPLTNVGKLYVPSKGDMVWMFVNTEAFASHINALFNK